MLVTDTAGGIFTPTNSLCPITGYSLTDDGGGKYALTNLAPGYEVRLSPVYLLVIGTYAEFEVEATASGGATATARGYMRVGPPEYDCQTATLTQPADLTAFVPQPGNDYWETLVASGSSIISAAAYGCSQSFAVNLYNDGDGSLSAAPAYYEINSATGELKFNNRADNLVSEKIVITVSSTDGVADPILGYGYPYDQPTAPISVTSSCGPDSTIVTKPEGLEP
jgi:hypothetical protein